MIKIKSNEVITHIEHREVELETSKGLLKIAYSNCDDMEWESVDDEKGVMNELTEDEDDELYEIMDRLQSLSMDEIKKEFEIN